MRHVRPRHYPRSTNNWIEVTLGLGLIAVSAAMLGAYFWFALSYDCRWQLKLSDVSQHLCHLMGY